MSRVRIGIDLGGTKIEALALGPGGDELVRLRIPTPKGYEETLEALADLVTEVEERAGGTAPVGVGMPGTISPATGLVKNANSTWLIGHPLDTDLAARLGRPVRIMNDANCFALSEASDGAGVGADMVFGVILGTGVGGGIVLKGEPWAGAQLVAGEWGHNPLPWPTDQERPGPTCYCGKSGCVETFLSGPGMERDHRRVTGTALSTREIVDAWQSGDDEAAATHRRYLDRLARALATVVNVLDPDVVVLGGGMSNLPGLAQDVQQSLGLWVFTDEVRTRVVKNHHGDSSGVRGAAWLWPAQD
ncbi:MAG TPA: ROK family protein [Longimicrobiales bacterium]|nr:ROK family protein [Longimicrobiales bacterium]